METGLKMTIEQGNKREYNPEDKVTGSLSMKKKQWERLKELAKKEGCSMSYYVANKLKL